MRWLAGLFFVIASCTHAPVREPAAACTAFGKPLNMDEIRSAATEVLEQYHGIRDYMSQSFYPRLQQELERSARNCEIEQNFRGLQADLNYSLNYFKQKLEDSHRLGMRVLDPRVIESLACMKPVAEDLRPGFEQLKKGFASTVDALTAWEKEFKLSTTTPDCNERKEWPGLPKAMSSLLQSSGPISGSAFIAEAGGRKYLVTAAHVSSVTVKPKRDPKEKDPQLVTKNADGLIEQETMGVYPGEIDLALDITFKPTSRPSRAFKVAASHELANLKAGTPFYALGFPLALRGRVDAVPCVFEGFIPGQRKSREAQLLLYCPGRGNSKGISGGPLVDEEGRVWGMSSSQTAYSGALLATPVLEKDGKLQQGVGGIFQSALCYNRNLTYRGSCTVMPNMYETEVP